MEQIARPIRLLGEKNDMRRLMLTSLLAAAAMIVTAGCESEEEAPTEALSGPALPTETIDQGDQSGIVLEELQVRTIRAQEEWAEFWSDHQSHVMPPPALPQLDFSRDMVIAAVDRQQPSGGYSLEIAGVQAPGGELEVALTRTVPGEGCVVTQVITQPYHIVRTDRVDQEPRIALEERTDDCG